MWAAPDVAALWQTVVDEALALIAADGAAVVTYTGRFWPTDAAPPSDAAPDDSAAAAVIEMLFRQDQLQQPTSIDDPGEGVSSHEVGRRAFLVVGIEGAQRQPVRLVWYATSPGILSPYADLAEAFASLRPVWPWESRRSVTTSAERCPPRHRVGMAQGILMTRRQLGRPGVRSAQTRVAERPRKTTNDRSESHSDRRSARW